MRTLVLAAITAISFLATVQADDSTLASPEWFGLRHLSEYLGLRPDDISFRQDYLEPDSFRLQKVAELMSTPLSMIPYSASVKDAVVKGQPEIAAGIIYSDLRRVEQSGRKSPYRASVSEMQGVLNLYYTNMAFNQLLNRARIYLDVVFPGSRKKMLQRLNSEEKRFLTTKMTELFRTSTEEEFMSAEALDSLEKIEEEFVDQFVSFGSRIDPDPVIAAGIDCLREIMLEVNALRREVRSGGSIEELLSTQGYLPDGTNKETYLGLQEGWRIGTTGNDYYSGDFKLIFDPGGDDVYDLSYDPKNPHGVIIIDLSGNDVYRAQTDFAIASGCLSTGLLLDFEGDDRYDGKSFSLGSGFFGFGLLYDAKGNDRYNGDTFTEGAGCFGLGMIIDEDGRDIYDAALYSQGFGGVLGAGVIYELGGSDSYYAGGKYKDHLRYEDHYLSLSQGFAYGFRPSMSGGIGAIVDLEGNDSYYADIFAQGCSYWFSLGMIYDSSGNDSYNCFQYGQGSATHMTLGILVDDKGNDSYFGKGLMQGVGHDYSCGILLDRSGNDTYTAYDLSQGAGSADGAGVLIDNEGEDRYFIKNRANSQGYGNPRRDFGSIGLFIDLGGKDQYNGNGRNNYYWKTKSKWGGGIDIELDPPDSSDNEENKK